MAEIFSLNSFPDTLGGNTHDLIHRYRWSGPQPGPLPPWARRAGGAPRKSHESRSKRKVEKLQDYQLYHRRDRKGRRKLATTYHSEIFRAVADDVGVGRGRHDSSLMGNGKKKLKIAKRRALSKLRKTGTKMLTFMFCVFSVSVIETRSVYIVVSNVKCGRRFLGPLCFVSSHVPNFPFSESPHLTSYPPRLTDRTTDPVRLSSSISTPPSA